MESKEIFSILYHNTKRESIDHLRNLIKELEERGKRFMICSHSTIPEDIIIKCESYFYDSNNYLFDSGIPYTYWMDLGNSILYSPYLYYGGMSHKNYSLAAIKNIFNSLVASYQLGFNVLHSVEYDCIPNFSDIEDNCDQLLNYNAVVYKNPDTEMFGHIFSVKLNSLIDLKWDEDYWVSSIKKHNCFSEKFIFSLIERWSEGRVLIKSRSNQTDSKVSSASNLQTVLFEENNTLKVFLINSSTRKIQNISLYCDCGKINLELDPNNWRIFPLYEIEKISFLDVFIEDKILRKWELTTEENYDKFVAPNRIEYK